MLPCSLGEAIDANNHVLCLLLVQGLDLDVLDEIIIAPPHLPLELRVPVSQLGSLGGENLRVCSQDTACGLATQRRRSSYHDVRRK